MAIFPPGSPASRPTVVELDAEDTHDLRLQVLRSHLPPAEVDLVYPADRAAGSFHLGVRDGDEVVAIATFSLEPAPGNPGRSAARLRGMAVAPDHQGSGLGAALVEEAMARLTAEGVELCWANARHSALGFYGRLGFREEGEDFESQGLPHRVVVREVRAP